MNNIIIKKIQLHCKYESVYCTPFYPNAYTVLFLVCVKGRFSVQYTLSFYSVGCRQAFYNLETNSLGKIVC